MAILKHPVAVILGTPSLGTWKAKTAVDAISMAVWAVSHGIYVEPRGAEGAYTESNRNNIVRSALDYGNPIDAIMWLDADMRAPPETLHRFWEHKKDIIGATYREREEPHRYLGGFLDGDDKHAKGHGLHKMRLMPGGMILVRLEVYRKLPFPWYKLDDDGLRDDYYFCDRAREAGYTVWCDMDLTRKVKHRGDQDVGWYRDGEAPVSRADPRRPKVDFSLVGGADPGRGVALSALEKAS